MFERFGTLSDIDGGGGTGLGLAIARWVTDLHDGTIGFVDPEPGEHGARVRADLPLAPDPLSRGRRARWPQSAPHPWAALPPQPPSTPSRRGRPPSLHRRRSSATSGPTVASRATSRCCSARSGSGVLAGVVLPFRDLGLGTFLVLLAAGGVLLAASRNRRDPFTLTCAALCVALSATVVVRDAEWIVVLCLLAGAGLCAVGLARGRSVPSFVLAWLAWPLAGLRGLPWLGRTVRMITGPGQRGRAAADGGVVGARHHRVRPAVRLRRRAVRRVGRRGGARPRVGRPSCCARSSRWPSAASCWPAPTSPSTRRGLDRGERAARPVAHRFEWLAPVLVVDAVFVAFLVAQATVVFGGHDYLERTTGLTYAEYVHQGFGQLTVATALTLLVIWAATRKAPRETSADRAWIRASLGLLCVLTLVVVASALYRMHVYQEAYGFTRLRLLVDVFEGWLGLLVLATMAGGVALRAAWLPRFGLFSGVALLLGLAALNPDAWIAQQNLDRYEATGKVDWTYLAGLSDDAVPVLATLPRRPRRVRARRSTAARRRLAGVEPRPLARPRVHRRARRRLAAPDGVPRADRRLSRAAVTSLHRHHAPPAVRPQRRPHSPGAAALGE